MEETHSKLTKELAYEKLKTVIDPELDVDIVSLGLIYDVTFEGKGDDLKVIVVMTLTSPGCPLIDVLEDLVKGAFFGVLENTQEQVVVSLTFDPPWVPDMMDEEIRLELGL